MRRRSGVWLALLVVAASVAGCGREPEPVAVLAAAGAPIELAGPGFATVELRFELLAELPEDAGEPAVFVHLIDAGGEIVRTFDHELGEAWWPGQTLTDRVVVHLSALAPPPAAGEYRLTAGLYDLDRGKYPLRTSLPRVAKQEYEVARVVVTPAAAGPVEFEGAWLAAEPDRDRQVLGARSLGVAGSGTLRLDGWTPPGELFVRLALPGLDGRGGRVELEAGAAEPAVTLHESCSGATRELHGRGAHDVVLAIAGAAGGAACRVELRPNFRIRPASGSAPSSVRVQAVSWNATTESTATPE